MKISELRARQGSVNVEATVKSMEEPRTFNKYGKDLRVVNAIISDDSGSIKLSLWNDDVDKVHVGDSLRITNGFVNEFKGENQLTTGKFGKLEITKHGLESKAEAKADASEKVDIQEDEDVSGDDAGEEYTEDY